MNNINKSKSFECHCSAYACQGDYNYSMRPNNRSITTLHFYLNMKRQFSNLMVLYNKMCTSWKRSKEATNGDK